MVMNNVLNYITTVITWARSVTDDGFGYIVVKMFTCQQPTTNAHTQ